jgi:hypothetical protein
MIGSSEMTLSRSEVDRDAKLCDSRVQHILRGQPRRRDGAVDLVVGQHGGDVQQVVEIDLEFRSRAAEPEELRQTQIELVDPVPILRPWLDQIDGDIRDAA